MKKLLLALSLICLLSPAHAQAGRRCRGGRCETTSVTVTASAPVQGGDFGATAHATFVFRSRQMVHAASPTGIEVVCLGCNQQTAVAIWRNSPPHAALLPRVRVIRCVGDACVGR